MPGARGSRATATAGAVGGLFGSLTWHVIALARLLQRKTVVAVAHRRATLAPFDRVIVVANGCVVEDGPPTLLEGQGGPYEKLWRLQVAGAAHDGAMVESLPG